MSKALANSELPNYVGVNKWCHRKALKKRYIYIFFNGSTIKEGGGVMAVPLRKKVIITYFPTAKVPTAIKLHLDLNGTAIKKRTFFCGFSYTV